MQAALLGLALLAGCARGRPAAPSTTVQAAPPLLSVAPPSARVAVRLAPRELLAHPGAAALWDTFVAPERERGFTERTGIDPRRLFDVLFVELSEPEGAFLLLLRGPFDAEASVREAGERLAFVEVSVDRPWARREGLRGEGRWAYQALAPDTLVIARDTPPAQLAAFVDRSRGQAPSTLGAEARALAERYENEPLAVLVPAPLELPGEGGAALLLARQRALALVLRPEPGRFDVALDLRGEFPSTAEANFRALIESLADTRLGAELGLPAALGSLRVTHAPERGRVQLGLSVATAELVDGLRLLFADELEGMFQP